VRKSERRLSTNPEEYRTSNVQRRTSNGRRESSFTSAFDVRCSTFDVCPSVSTGEFSFRKKTKDGKFIYKSNDFFGVRVGDGGPELKFDAFNGDIRILSQEQ